MVSLAAAFGVVVITPVTAPDTASFSVAWLLVCDDDDDDDGGGGGDDDFVPAAAPVVVPSTERDGAGLAPPPLLSALPVVDEEDALVFTDAFDAACVLDLGLGGSSLEPAAPTPPPALAPVPVPMLRPRLVWEPTAALLAAEEEPRVPEAVDVASNVVAAL